MAEPLRAGVGGEVGGAVLVAVRVAVEARRTDAGQRRLAIVGGVELLLRERRQQQAQSFQLPGRENAVEHLVVVGERDQLALRDITEIGARGQVHRRRKRGQKAFGQIEIDVEAGQVAVVLPLYRVDRHFRKHKAAGRVEGMRQGKEALWPEAALTNLIRAHRCELPPSHAAWQLDTHPFLERFSALHGDALGRAVA